MDYLFPLLAAVIWGANTIVTKLAASVISPAAIGCYRWGLVVLVLTPILARALYRNRATIGRHFPQLAVLGLLGCVIFQSLAYFAANYTSALHMGVIQCLLPIFSLALTAAWLGQRMTAATIVGTIVSLAGVILVITKGDIPGLLAQGLNRGDAMILVGTVAYSVYNVLLKRWHIPLPVMQSLYVQAAVAALVLLPLAALSPHHAVTADNAPLILFSSVFASLLSPVAWMHGIARLGPARVSPFFNLIPIVTAVLAVLLLDESLTTSLVLGGLLTLGGVMLAEWQTRRAAARVLSQARDTA